MSMTVNELAAAEGISAVTLYAWRKEARMQGRLIPDREVVTPIQELLET
jgi:transposase-like protein